MSPSIPSNSLTAFNSLRACGACEILGVLGRRLHLAAALIAQAHAAGEQPVESILGLLHVLILPVKWVHAAERIQ